MAVRSDGKRVYVSSGTLRSGVIAVVNTANDKLVKRITVGTGGKAIMGVGGGGSALGLATDPFWWFEQ